MLSEPSLFFLINQRWTCSSCDWIMALASNFAFWLPILVLLGLIIIWRGGSHARVCILCLILTVLCVEAIDGPLKKIFHRPRPYQQMAGVRQVELNRSIRPKIFAIFKPLSIQYSNLSNNVIATSLVPQKYRSFPSGHTLNNFAIATIVFLFYRRWGWLTFGFACLVGYSRVYVGSHWPTDVLISAPLGVGLALCFANCYEWIWKKLHKNPNASLFKFF